jgi:hypothetical protein
MVDSGAFLSVCVRVCACACVAVSAGVCILV